jgi:S1-C subfamily serine protease
MLAAALLGCGSRPAATPSAAGAGVAGPGGPPDTPTGSAAASSPLHLAQVGVVGRPSQTEPRGLQVTGFVPSSKPWPLDILGVKKGDVIVTCNGQREQIGVRLIAALEGLQSRGETVTLEVIRDGRQMKLERSEKLPAAETAQGSK